MCPEDRACEADLRTSLRWSKPLNPFISGGVVVVSFEVASFGLGKSSDCHQHWRNCHPQPSWGSWEGHPTAGTGPCWKQARLGKKGRREEKPADSCFWLSPNYPEFLGLGIADIVFPSGITEVMRLFASNKRKESEYFLAHFRYSKLISSEYFH